MNNIIEIQRPETAPQYAGDWVTCSCCGKDVHDTPETNRDFDERGQDTGYGNCTECFGEVPKPLPKGQLPTEAECRNRLGWAGECFYDSRIETLGKALKGVNAEKFAAMPYSKKIIIIAKMIERGSMV